MIEEMRVQNTKLTMLQKYGKLRYAIFQGVTSHQ